MTESEEAVCNVHSSTLTFVIVTESEAAISSVHSSVLTCMIMTESLKRL